jgi:Regulatory P domain of the subtilisin-like proprotein convertases and other proteases
MKSFSMRTRIILSVVVVGGLTSLFFTNCSSEGFATLNNDNLIGSSSLGNGDPLINYAWHLENIAQKVFASKSGTAGMDLDLLSTNAQGISGAGVRVMISDDGVEDTHEDLYGNFLAGSFSKDYTTASPYTAATARPSHISDNHGTAVAGIIAAMANNGVGARGVAPGAKFASSNFLSASVSQTVARMSDQATGDYDILNMSWGGSQNTLVLGDSTFESTLLSRVTNGRSGKGVVFIKSAGNDFRILCNGSGSTYCVGNSNFDGDNTNPFIMMTAASNAAGKVASYSSPGANLWVTAPAGEFGYDTPAMVTTDRTGCDKGFAGTSVTTQVAFDKGSNGNSKCNYSVTFNGTSAAAPVVTGVVALLLEANPNLSWRDVRYILAKTAVPLDYITSGYVPHPLGTASPTNYAWDQVWVTNKAGFHFHNWYGFGQVDVDAAVAMAKSYTSSFGTYQSTGWYDKANLSLAVPDNSATGVSSVMTVSSTVKVEAVQLRIYIAHNDLSELALELTSPSGTRSVVINMNNSLTGMKDYLGEVFLTNAFYQEVATGNWTLKVIDGKSGSNVGTLTRWSLNIWGAP